MLWCSKEPTWLASRTKNTNKKRSSFCECFHYLLFNMWHWGAAIQSSKAQNIKSSLSPPKFQSARATNKNRFSFLLFSFSQSLLIGKKKGHPIGKSHYFLRSLLPIALELWLSEILTRELFFTVTFLTCFEVHLFWGLWSHPLRKKHFDYSPLLRHQDQLSRQMKESLGEIHWLNYLSKTWKTEMRQLSKKTNRIT